MKALGLRGEIGTFAVDLKGNKLKATKGHKVVSSKAGEFEIESSRYPFCACEPEGQSAPAYPVCAKDDPAKDSSIRSGMTLIPFNAELNRLMLVARNGEAKNYKVTWGTESKSFTGDELSRGVNLTETFSGNPFGPAFAKVDAAVAAKQAYETKQIKQLFRSPEAKADMEAVATQTEKERQPLVAAIKSAFVPVTHTIKIEAE